MTTENHTAEVSPDLRTALGTIESMLDADGYGLTVDQPDPGSVQLTIDARPDACEDCLVPKPLMSSIIQSTLETAGLGGLAIELVYPTDPAS
ncbi:MAG TPA: hypothetical protein VK611_08315 [Acidimicrobiales bacterium]|nr:hypothetical protein [Acidimicrobiales bacterium]